MTQKGGKGTSTKREQTAQRIIKAVKESKGLLTVAAARAGIGYRTILRYSNEFPTVKKAVIEAKEELIDLTESKLYNAIEEGNMTAIIFFLKTQAKDRGYIEKSEIAGEVKTIIEVHYEK